MGKTLNELAGTVYMGKNIKYNDNEDLLLENAIEKRNREKEVEDAAALLREAAKKKQDDINSKLEGLEMLPMGSKVILAAYPKNPYRKIMDGSIITDWDGSFLNPDTGEMDKQKELIGCAEVIEVGPECKYLKPGDDVYYDTRTVYPVPFMSLGYILTIEGSILCVLNDKLKQRFNMEE